MEETPLQSRLSLLNYTKEWVDYGLLTEERLKEQTIELQKGEDHNTKHYRDKVLKDYLESWESIEDEKLDQLLDILNQDDDKAMASSVAIEILYYKEFLNDSQFQKVKDLLLAFSGKMLKYIEKAERKRLAG